MLSGFLGTQNIGQRFRSGVCHESFEEGLNFQNFFVEFDVDML
jgi:hypothetical protein